MDLRRSLTTLAMVLAMCAPAWAATITGTYTYDGVAVATVYNDLTGGRVQAYPFDGSGDSVWGTVDLVAGTFRIENVPVGENVAVQLELDRSQPSDNDGYDGGDLIGSEVTTVASASDTVEVPIDVRSVVHFTTPFDSDAVMNGTFNSCPVGDATASPASVRWDAVPNVTDYSVWVRQQRCDNSSILSTHRNLSTPEISVDLGTEDEDHVAIWVDCTGNAGTNLCFMPFIGFSDGSVQAYVFRESGGSSGRGTDHADGFFIPAVARTSGAGSSYWSTEVTVVNTGSSQQQVEIVYTPQNGDGWTNYQATDVTMDVGTARNWSDVLDELFSSTGAGSLEVRGDDLFISSRTSTPRAEGGTYGLGIPPLASRDLLSYSGNSSAFAGGVKEEPGVWRTNFGVCEVSGKTAQVRVTVYDGSGVSMGTRVITLGPYENTQINRVVRAVTNTNRLDNGVIGVEVTGATGKVGAYLTIIDSATNDSTYTVIAPQSPTGG